MRPLLFSIALFANLLPTPSRAQQAPAAEQGVPVDISVCCLRYLGDVRSLYVRRNAQADPEEMTVYLGGFSRPERVLAFNGAVPVYAKTTDAAGKETWSVAGKIPLGSGDRAATVILLPDEAARTANAAFPYRPFLFPSYRDFDYGAAMILNLTKWNVSCVVGKKAFAAAPGKHTAVSFKAEVDPYDNAPAKTAVEIDGQWRTIHTTVWHYHERIRFAAIVWFNTATNQPEITTIRDIKDAVAQKPTPP